MLVKDFMLYNHRDFGPTMMRATKSGSMETPLGNTLTERTLQKLIIQALNINSSKEALTAQIDPESDFMSIYFELQNGESLTLIISKSNPDSSFIKVGHRFTNNKIPLTDEWLEMSLSELRESYYSSFNYESFYSNDNIIHETETKVLA